MHIWRKCLATSRAPDRFSSAGWSGICGLACQSFAREIISLTCFVQASAKERMELVCQAGDAPRELRALPTNIRTMVGSSPRSRHVPEIRQMGRKTCTSRLSGVRYYVHQPRCDNSQGRKDFARVILERAVRDLGKEAESEKLFISFAQFEERMKEVRRRSIPSTNVF